MDFCVADGATSATRQGWFESLVQQTKEEEMLLARKGTVRQIDAFGRGLKRKWET
jgi:hypothetical protein